MKRLNYNNDHRIELSAKRRKNIDHVTINTEFEQLQHKLYHKHPEIKLKISFITSIATKRQVLIINFISFLKEEPALSQIAILATSNYIKLPIVPHTYC
ncbi:hypothetical protein [Candidatus Tisiphia endosymbiont of Nemotelus uliginosus]|uniref:hypothetical protein n=1 Tax=Candidatus Tisiphia endosymbiont of Nemotelus uliginosus TaxID=3077926 RepID=UPI0035C8E6F0